MNTIGHTQRPLRKMPLAAASRGGRKRRLPHVVILGGGANALSIARSLRKFGATVYALNEASAPVRHSRYCQWIDVGASRNDADTWTDYLTGSHSDHLRGGVLLAGSDTAIEIIARHRETLQERYLLDESNPQAQLCMLNKLCTYRVARAAGVPTPRFWVAKTRGDVVALRGLLVFPLIVKPQLSHVFVEKFHQKFFVAENYEELLAAFDVIRHAEIDVLLVEKIVGPDDRLCSYYTYLDADGNPAFDFTKRIIRRYPMNMGLGCYHVTDRGKEVRRVSLKLFRSARLRGLANAEFKRDERDGKLKLIECNARFTAANELVRRAGFDLARFVYCRIVGLPGPRLGDYRSGMRLWYPVNDFRAFLELRRKGQLTFPQWIASIMHRQTLPLFRWEDPWPSVATMVRRLAKLVHFSGVNQIAFQQVTTNRRRGNEKTSCLKS